MPAAVNETMRLRALQRLRLLDTGADEAFDRITRLACRLFEMPGAMVSLLDADRLWPKSALGIAHGEIARGLSFCTHAIASDRVMVVADALHDARFAGNPLVCESGLRFYAGAPLITAEGQPIGTLCVFDTRPRVFDLEQQRGLRDLAYMVMTQIELAHGAGRLDETTQLRNRSGFIADFQAMAQSGARGRKLALAIEPAGPLQMHDIARSVGFAACETMMAQSILAAGDLLGPEVAFYQLDRMRIACIIDDAEAFGWHDLAGRLVERLRAPVDCGGVPLVPSPAVGVVPFRAGSVVARDLIRRMLATAHEARGGARGGESGWAAYDPRSDLAQQRAFGLMGDLRQAVRRPDELSLVYQPRIDLRSGRCVSAEALLRWRHPTLGDVGPGEFVPLIEQTALTASMTDWVLEAACAQAVALRDRGLAIRLSVNVSASDFGQGRFPARLAAALARHGLAAEALEVEVTERVLLIDNADVSQQLRELRLMGVAVAIDDFGVGYSNLGYLKQLPANVVKLDQSFMRTLASSRSDRTIVRGMIAMAHDLGCYVVAEGVETPHVRELISEWGCDEAQGYGIARPMAVPAFLTWLDRARLAAMAVA